MSDPLSLYERMQLIAELEARTKPVTPPANDLGAIARGLAYFGRMSEHDHRLALEREGRADR